MSDRTIRLLVDLTYNADLIHGDDKEAIAGFYNVLFGSYLSLLDRGDLGDEIGSIKVIKELTGDNEVKGGKDE